MWVPFTASRQGQALRLHTLGDIFGEKPADGHQALSVETDFWEAYERYVLKRGINEKTGLIKLRQWDRGGTFSRPAPVTLLLLDLDRRDLVLRRAGDRVAMF